MSSVALREICLNMCFIYLCLCIFVKNVIWKILFFFMYSIFIDAIENVPRREKT